MWAFQVLDGMFINGVACASTLGGPNAGGAGGTTVVVSGDVGRNSDDCNENTVMLVNGYASSDDAPCNGVTSLGDNDTVGGAENDGNSVG